MKLSGGFRFTVCKGCCRSSIFAGFVLDWSGQVSSAPVYLEVEDSFGSILDWDSTNQGKPSKKKDSVQYFSPNLSGKSKHQEEQVMFVD